MRRYGSSGHEYMNRKFSSSRSPTFRSRRTKGSIASGLIVEGQEVDPLAAVFHARWLVYSSVTLEEGMAHAFLKHCKPETDALLASKKKLTEEIIQEWGGDFEDAVESLKISFQAIGFINRPEELRNGVLMFESMVSVISSSRYSSSFENDYWSQFEKENSDINDAARLEMKLEVVPACILDEEVASIDLVTARNLHSETAERLKKLPTLRLLWKEEFPTEKTIDSYLSYRDIRLVDRLDLRESRAIYSCLRKDLEEYTSLTEQYRVLLRARLYKLVALQKKGKLRAAKAINPAYKCQNLWEGARTLETFLLVMPKQSCSLLDICRGCDFSSRHTFEVIKFALKRRSIRLDCSLEEVDLGRNSEAMITLLSKNT